MNHSAKALLSLARSTSGSSLVETALVLPFLVLVLAGAYDFGQAYFATIEVATAAEAGAQYGLQNVTNLTGMQNAAKLDAADVLNTQAVATYGCECSDGTAAVASCTTSPTTCTYNIVNYVQVVVTASYKPTLTYPGAPVSIPLSSTVRLRAGQ
ncbi:TadE/TadG family type IV pilus assembly protein [Granulicella paludicola]|uniref:TadE/TadG family type IV pilus assembly protein n=1 Tax=Granulicella paludicola TaxID=474951 RepID=UPI0021E0DBA9|nr:TadE/TadG family type IV pilus assembly protein [Granulicella paludicola]